jgi:hypothetical protein
MKRKIGTMAIAAALAFTTAQVYANDTPANPPGPASRTGAKAAAGAKITAAQRARLNEKLSIVSRLVANMEAGAKAEGLASGWRQAAMSALFSLSNETLASVTNISSPSQLPAAITAAKRVTPKALGDSTQDLVYTPITPCRYIDTRNVGGRINGTRSYDFDLNSYGGTCPNDPYGLFGGTLGALAVNIAIVDPQNAPGFATIVPVGASPSVALVNWYEFGPAVQASNAAIITNDQSGTLAEVDIFTSGLVHVIVDVFGGFRAPQATALDCVWIDQSSAMPAGSYHTDTATCGAGYELAGGGCYTSGVVNVNWNVISRANVAPETTWFCGGTAATATTLNTSARCCRVPGR